MEVIFQGRFRFANSICNHAIYSLIIHYLMYYTMRVMLIEARNHALHLYLCKFISMEIQVLLRFTYFNYQLCFSLYYRFSFPIYFLSQNFVQSYIQKKRYSAKSIEKYPDIISCSINRGLLFFISVAEESGRGRAGWLGFGAKQPNPEKKASRRK